MITVVERDGKLYAENAGEFLSSGGPPSYIISCADTEYRTYDVLEAIRVYAEHQDDEGGVEFSVWHEDGRHEVLAKYCAHPFPPADERILTLEEKVRKLETDVGFLKFDVQVLSRGKVAKK